MKITQTISQDVELDITISSVHLHMDKDGILAMIHIADAVEDDSYDKQMSWNEVLKSAMASSEDHEDAKAIVLNLRAVADKLEDWNRKC